MLTNVAPPPQTSNLVYLRFMKLLSFIFGAPASGQRRIQSTEENRTIFFGFWEAIALWLLLPRRFA
jgi:hypothetical protein